MGFGGITSGMEGITAGLSPQGSQRDACLCYCCLAEERREWALTSQLSVLLPQRLTRFPSSSAKAQLFKETERQGKGASPGIG